MKITKIAAILAIAISSLQLQGCFVAAVGAGIGAAKYGTAKKKQANAANKEVYNKYVLGMEKINMERQEHHLKRDPILTYHEYMAENPR